MFGQDAGKLFAPSGGGGSAPTRPDWRVRLSMSPAFHRLADRVPFLRGLARREGAALFDIIQGFVKSQILMALVQSEVLTQLAERPARTAAIAGRIGLTEDRALVFLRAGAALGLVALRKDHWHLTPRAGAFLAIPGLDSMVRHHEVLYRDLADPLALLRGERAPELAAFWPYVFGDAAAVEPELATRYSRLMADSQLLVAQDTLRLVDLAGVRRLMDVGGGTGVFLSAAAEAKPELDLMLVDLPAVVAGATLPEDGPARRVIRHPADFRTEPLPKGADAISLVRVLYDHTERRAAALLASCFAALPPGGRLIISEPMSGGARPDAITDMYFAVYTLAMGTGRTRSATELTKLVQAAGFTSISERPGSRSYITSVLEARKPAL